MALSIETLLLAKKLAEGQGGGSSGTTNYNELSNLPSINDVTLKGNKSIADIGGVASVAVKNLWVGSQAEYDAISTKDLNTLYFIKEE